MPLTTVVHHRELSVTPLHHAGGYTGLGDVQAKTGGAQIDAMESFFLSETLKYLFLLFSPRELVQLESNLFNTEAHLMGNVTLAAAGLPARFAGAAGVAAGFGER